MKKFGMLFLEVPSGTVCFVGTDMLEISGYMAPDYAMEGLHSTKSDIFSFGVLLLEIITSRRNAGFHRTKRAPSLIAYVSTFWLKLSNNFIGGNIAFSC
ncbi:cysteine-rich receptor-like protein kinase 10 [Tripterygium wilfordii]|uniref:cysteine-rich receptor-like protein kinase 10 n=1 Tax=Tripterygium wilfordii TaxID=458696 RepID=UPI0018F84BB8|nr:cysteine-rich receptor-like protein kinase 10 [Tripterygium wilfordii]